MKQLSRLILATALCVIATTAAQAQMPAPAPELKKLDFLVGTWNSAGDMKPGPMGPGGKMSMTGKNEWMQGGYFLVMHSSFSSDMGKGSSVAYMGYDGDDKHYTYDEFNSMGERDHSTGSVDGDTWTWNGSQKMGGQSMNGRFTMKVSSPSSYTFKFEMSPDGTTWNTMMDGKATKVQ